MEKEIKAERLKLSDSEIPKPFGFERPSEIKGKYFTQLNIRDFIGQTGQAAKSRSLSGIENGRLKIDVFL